eukprot:5574688-Pyramimonas_sp.AAC.1
MSMSTALRCWKEERPCGAKLTAKMMGGRNSQSLGDCSKAAASTAGRAKLTATLHYFEPEWQQRRQQCRR